MVKHAAPAAALAAIALAASCELGAHAFQSCRPLAARQVARPLAPSSSFRVATAGPASADAATRRSRAAYASGRAAAPSEQPPSGGGGSLFSRASRGTSRAIQRARRSLTVLLASLAFLLSSTRVLPAPPAHAASSAAVATTTTKLSLAQRLNPLRTRSADELIDEYVRDRLFADDAYDPVESAYREAFADAGSVGGKRDGSATAAGAYPSLLAETAGAALGQQRSVSSLLSSSSASAGGSVSSSGSASSSSGKNDGITAVLIKASDFLQMRLRVSASVSYYILAASGLVGICVLPGIAGVLYQGIQRLQIDKSEMKMYGKIMDMDATSKRVTDDDDDDDDEE